MEAWNWANDPTQYETDMASFGDRVEIPWETVRDNYRINYERLKRYVQSSRPDKRSVNP